MSEASQTLAEYAEEITSKGAVALIFFDGQRFAVTTANQDIGLPGVLICETANGLTLMVALNALAAILESDGT